MADIGQVLATGGTTIVGVGVGAGLTYWFGALNRRHQEARENETRWYEARRQAYAEFSQAVTRGVLFRANSVPTQEERLRVQEELASLLGVVRLVGSYEVIEEVSHVFWAAVGELREPKIAINSGRLQEQLYGFEVAARQDLGYDTQRLEPGSRHERDDDGDN